MKKVKFALTVAGVTTIVLTSMAVYVMQNEKLKRKVGKKLMNVMSYGEDIIKDKMY